MPFAPWGPANQTALRQLDAGLRRFTYSLNPLCKDRSAQKFTRKQEHPA